MKPIDGIPFIPKVMSYQWRLIRDDDCDNCEVHNFPCKFGFYIGLLRAFNCVCIYLCPVVCIIQHLLFYFSRCVAPVTLVLWMFDSSDISVMNLHIGTCLVLLQIVLSYINAVKSLIKIFDSIPRIVSYSITYSNYSCC